MTVFEKIANIEKQAHEFHFRWTEPSQILEQIKSECDEIEENLHLKGSKDHLQEEIGDLIFASCSLSLFHGFDPEHTLMQSLEKFEKRFALLKNIAQQSGLKTLEGQPFAVLDALWQKVKQIEIQEKKA